MMIIGAFRSGSAAMRIIIGFVCAVCMVATMYGQTPGSMTTVVQTASGPVQGSGGDIRVFKGIPYAAAPIGARRWRPPGPPEPWLEVRDGTQFGPECPQPADFNPQGVPGATPIPSSEDCLTINVWTPATSDTGPLPVMVWIHGGAFAIGSGARPQYNVEALARRGVVLVTVNYRLGALGFFAHPELSRESENGVSGNYALLDQIAGLRWVQANIAAFGGDPAQVTLFGQSAGASSIGLLMISPLAKNLFQRAILQSPSSNLAGVKPKLRESYYGLEAAEIRGASINPSIAALRALSADEIVTMIPNPPSLNAGLYPNGPIVDGYVVPDDPDRLLGTRNQAKVQVLIGHNADEGLAYRRDAPETITAYHDFVSKTFPAQLVDEVLAMYPAMSDAEAPGAAMRMFGDQKLVTPTVLTARSATEVADVYMYRFSRVNPLTRSRSGGAAHGAEIPYVFDNIPSDTSQFDGQDLALARVIADAWVQFAKTGNPNGDGLPKWPLYRSPEFQILDYGDDVTIGSNALSPAVDFFRSAFPTMARSQ